MGIILKGVLFQEVFPGFQPNQRVLSVSPTGPVGFLNPEGKEIKPAGGLA